MNHYGAKLDTYAIGRVGDSDAKVRLTPLIFGGTDINGDPNDQLKGCALSMLWPDHLSAVEVFSVLTLPKNPHFTGRYVMFFSRDLFPSLKLVDLPVALRWVAEQSFMAFRHPLATLIDNILTLAWDHLEIPGVPASFAQAALNRLKMHDQLPKLPEDVFRRRNVFEAMLPLLSLEENDWFRIFYGSLPLLRSDDVPWLLTILEAATEADVCSLLVKIIRRCFDPFHLESFEAVFAACARHSDLAAAFTDVFRHVDVRSPEADQMRAAYQQHIEWESTRQAPDEPEPFQEPPPAEQIRQLLDSFEAGDLSAWWQMNMMMTVKENIPYYADEHEPDLKALPGWIAADTATRIRIIEAAKRYVLEADLPTQEWLGKDGFDRSAYAGYRALHLLTSESSVFIEALQSDAWKRWAPILVAYPLSESDTNATMQQSLVRTACKWASDEIISTVVTLIEQERHGTPLCLTAIKAVRDDRLAQALMQQAQNSRLNPTVRVALLSECLSRRDDNARAYAEQVISSPMPAIEEERVFVELAIQALIEESDDAGWQVVWPILVRDTHLGSRVMLDIAHKDRHASHLQATLSEQHLSDLYLWLSEQFPHTEDPIHHGVHQVTPRDDIVTFRGRCLQQLVERGTPEALIALQRIQEKLPHLDWLLHQLVAADVNLRRNAWVPPTPSIILKMARDANVYLVQNADHLLEVVLASLQKLQRKLQGETYRAPLLWDKEGTRLYKPSDEETLSDYVKNHLAEDLRDRGVIANREVQIRRGTGSAPGEDTDIHVDAVIVGKDGRVVDSVSVIIEAKGCWNTNIKTAMQEQLVDRYLKDNPCQHGVFLVGWYMCPQWNRKDYRRGNTPKMDVDTARSHFEKQASIVSQSGITVAAVVLDVSLR